jgi:membrane protease YdiL (CAAX protease family)
MSLVVVGGLVVVAVAWAALFAPGRAGFWRRALAAGLVIGAYGAIAQRHRLGHLLHVAVVDLAVGVAGAAALYGLFRGADRLLRALVPGVAAAVGRLYQFGGPTRAWYVPVVLVVVGACEEIFWRGFVQARAGVAVGLVGYAAVHLWERNAALVLAALAGGAAWGALFAWRGTLVAPIACHALWDLAVVVWFPFRNGK